MLSLSFFFSCSLVSLLWEKVNGVEAFGGDILMAITSKVEKVLMASSFSKELKLLNSIPNLNLSFNLSPPSQTHRLTASIDFDSEEDTFYDCQEWPCPASDSKDVFHSANDAFSPSWSSSESETPPPPRPENNNTNWTNEAEYVSSSEENNLSYFFFQDQFWNHDYRNVDLQQRNNVVKVENQTELVQFLEDRFWYHQADAGGRRKRRSLPCFPCIGKSKGKGKPPSNTVSTSIQENTHNSELTQRKNSSRASCLPKTFTWIRFRGRKKPRPAPIHDL